MFLWKEKKIINEKSLVYLAVFLLPTYLLKFKFFGFPTNFLEILILAAFLFCISNAKNQIKLKEYFLKNKALFFWLVVIFLSLLISSLANPNILKSLGIIKGWFLVPFILFLIVETALGEKERRNIFQIFFWSAFTVSYLGMIYYFLGFLTYDGRLKAFFNSPNYLAMYLTPAFVIGWVFFKEKKKIYRLALAVIIIALYLTFSYAAWLALFFSLFLVELIKRNRLSFKKALYFLAILLIISLTQVSSQKIDILQNSRSSLSSRIMIWKSAGKIINDNWILGIGPANFQEKYLEYQKYFPPYLEWAVPHPHNLFLTFWVSGGIFGLLSFLGLLFFWLGKIRETKNSRWKMAAIGIMLCILFQGAVDTTYFKNDLAFIFWMLFLSL